MSSFKTILMSLHAIKSIWIYFFLLIKKGTVVCVPESIYNSKITHFIVIRMDAYCKHNIHCCYQNCCWTGARKVYFSSFWFAFPVCKAKCCCFPGFHQLCPGFPMDHLKLPSQTNSYNLRNFHPQKLVISLFSEV